MKKLTVLLLAAALLCTCFVLAACSEDGADTSSATETSSAAATSSEATTSSEAESSKEETTEDTTTVEPPALDTSDKPFWLTHYYDAEEGLTQLEGAGVIFYEEYEGAQWWYHVAFAPVDPEDVDGEEDVFEIVEVSNGLPSGGGVPLAIPEGGFVYAINTGNNWPKLVAENPGQYTEAEEEGWPNYVTPDCSAMVATVQTWKVGDKIGFKGIDPDGVLLPTDTPDIEWWEKDTEDPIADGPNLYVCTATWHFVER